MLFQKTVLFVHDQPDEVVALKDFSELRGFIAEGLSDTRQAYDWYRENHKWCGAVVTDLEFLSDADNSLEFIDQLRVFEKSQDLPKVPVLLYSAYYADYITGKRKRGELQHLSIYAWIAVISGGGIEELFEVLSQIETVCPVLKP